MTHFNSDFFAKNRAELRKRVGSGPIVITANGSMQRGADESFKFSQDSNFWYLTGLSTPDLLLVMLDNEEFLIAPELSLERQVFDGSLDLPSITERSGIATILTEREGWQRIKHASAHSKHIFSLGTPPPYLARHRMHILPYRRRLLGRLKRLNTKLEITDARSILATLRCNKQPEELRAIQSAIDITTQTLHDVVSPSILGSATHEFEIEAALSYGFRFRGADGHAFEPIVGAGAHSTTLHHVDNNGSITKGDVVVLDVGASVEHYAADITRTVTQQRPTNRQRAVFDAVKYVQNDALDLLKPGILLGDYESKVTNYMGAQLRKLGLITGNDAAAIRHYFPHATSHFLGLDTHDVGSYTEPLAANMVLTCEPGIYIPEENIGIRLEDDVLITAQGNTVMSRACPTDIGFVQ